MADLKKRIRRARKGLTQEEKEPQRPRKKSSPAPVHASAINGNRPRKTAPKDKRLWCLEMIYSGNKRDIRFRQYTDNDLVRRRFEKVPPVRCHKEKVYPVVTEVKSKRKQEDDLLKPYIEAHIGKL